ncbi:uncharacterized protein METZ01_LOCUS338710, partial [marine metagenome]
PSETQGDEPSELDDVVKTLMEKARLNADMSGRDREGPGFPPNTI